METAAHAAVAGTPVDTGPAADTHGEAVRHSVLRVDDVVHQRVRLGILATLHAADSADFSHLKQLLELTDGNLNRHLDVLVRAGFVTLTKTLEGRRRRTLATITHAGRSAFDAEIQQLERLASFARENRPAG